MGKAAIGILMLDTKFPRVLGDIGTRHGIGMAAPGEAGSLHTEHDGSVGSSDFSGV